MGDLGRARPLMKLKLLAFGEIYLERNKRRQSDLRPQDTQWPDSCGRA